MSMAVASACAFAAMQAQAQTPDAAPAEIPAPNTVGSPTTGGPAKSDQIQEVVVTATRFTTSLLKTPIAVTALSQDQLTRKGATSIRDLAGEIPNVVMDQGLDNGVQITVRGITSTNFTETGDPAVGFHVDGLYSPRPQGAQALLFDIDQFEVLRGPQGTLFGRNSTGGSVNVITAKPDFSGTYGRTEIDLGNYNKKQINVVQNWALSDSLALRGTFMRVTRDSYANQLQDLSEANYPSKGWIPNGKPDVDMRYNRPVGPSEAYMNQDQWAARLALAYKVNKDLTLRAAVENFQDNGAGWAHFRDCDAGEGTRYACTGGRWDINVNVPGETDMSIRTARAGLNWNINDHTSLDYNFQIADQRRTQISDDDLGMQNAPAWADIVKYPDNPNGNWGTWPLRDTWHRTADSRYLSTVHELQLKQKFSSLQYVAGLFWMHEKNRIDYEMTESIQQPLGDPGSVVYAQPDRQIDAKALFTQADWNFLPQWTMTLGARYSQDSKEDKNGKVYGRNWISDTAYYRGLFSTGIPGTPGYHMHDGTDLTQQMGWMGGPAAYAGYPNATNNDHKETWNKTTWRAGLQYQITPKQMVYASASTGYKAGGFADKVDSCNNHLCAATGKPGEPTFLPYGPEQVLNYELGYKGRFLDNRLSLSATAFYMKYKDMQLTGNYFVNQIIPDDGKPCPAEQPKCDVFESWRTINVGNTKIPGLELEWDYRPWKGARLGGGFAYINTSVHGFNNYSDDYQCGDVRAEFGIEPCPAVYNGPDKSLLGRKLYNIEGNHLPNTPKYQLFLNFSQEFQLANGFTVTPYVKVNWRDKAYFDLRNSDWEHIGRYQKAYAMTDASVRLDPPDNKWYVEAYVRNAANSHAKTNGDSVWGGFMQASYVEPRMFGVRASLSY
ncbi:MAG: TonB-dependent receptor [Gammaproteobacteria bacterium]